MMDLTIELSGGRFNHRVTGVLLQKNCLLIHRSKQDGFWSLPGGRIHLHENSESALRREMKEELGVDIEGTKLLWLAENFFTYDGQKYHEVGMYYLCGLPQQKINPKEDFYGMEGERLIYRWQPLDELRRLEVRPGFIQSAIHKLEFNHFVVLGF